MTTGCGPRIRRWMSADGPSASVGQLGGEGVLASCDASIQLSVQLVTRTVVVSRPAIGQIRRSGLRL